MKVDNEYETSAGIANVELKQEPDSPLDLSVFNVLKEMFGDNFNDVVKKHSESSLDNVKRIEVALANNDASELEHAAHSLKGASGQFGAKRLSELAMKIELFGKETEFDKAKNIFDELKDARDEAERLMQHELHVEV